MSERFASRVHAVVESINGSRQVFTWIFIRRVYPRYNKSRGSRILRSTPLKLKKKRLLFPRRNSVNPLAERTVRIEIIAFHSRGKLYASKRTTFLRTTFRRQRRETVKLKCNFLKHRFSCTSPFFYSSSPLSF